MMNKIQKQRLLVISSTLLCVLLAALFAGYALRKNINLFYTPSQIFNGEVPQQQVFRLGGLVLKNSVVRQADTLQVNFILSDTAHQVQVSYKGILPDLFREGQGVVVTGQLNNDNQFIAQQVLAKHDENYMPPQVRDAIDSIKQQKAKISR